MTAAGGSDFDPFSDDEVLEAALVAARTIHEHSLVRTTVVKQAVWESIDHEGRDRGKLWEYVSQVLFRMDSVSGRPDGRIWTAV